MYIQITTKCNFSCSHCCMNATKNGRHMKMSTFKKALEYDEMVALGGGEPTLHPYFERILLLAISHCGDNKIFIATNGSIKERALVLANLAKNGIICAALSQDEYHDPIDKDVIQAFTRPKKNHYLFSEYSRDCREVRTIQKIIKVGRAENLEESEEGCCCEGDAFCDVDGNIHICGCPDSPVIGNVFDGFEAPEEWLCYKAIEKIKGFSSELELTKSMIDR